MFHFVFIFAAGSCWFKRMDDGKCTKLVTRFVKKDECCAAGVDLGYSENDVTDVELFFIFAFNKTASCMPCYRKFLFLYLLIEFLRFSATK